MIISDAGNKDPNKEAVKLELSVPMVVVFPRSSDAINP